MQAVDKKDERYIQSKLPILDMQSSQLCIVLNIVDRVQNICIIDRYAGHENDYQ